MEFDIVIVGGGPVGCHLASHTAKSLRTVIIEEHREIGDPIQCAGLVTPRVIEMTGTQESVLNELSGAYFHFPGGQVIELWAKGIKALVVDRKNFDKICCDRATSVGSTLMLGTKFLGFDREKNKIKVMLDEEGEQSEITTNLLIGADGYKSKVAEYSGLGKSPQFVRGFQVDLDYEMDDQDAVHVYFGNKTAPGFFAWSIPCGSFTRIGLCMSPNTGTPSTYLRRLISRLGMEKCEWLRSYSGVIPIGVLECTYSDGLMIVGDAAGQAKPLSGGGLYTGCTAADCAARIAIRSLEIGDCSARTLASYQREWKKKIGRELERGYRLRKIFLQLNDKDLDEIASILKREEVVEVLSTGDIDFPSLIAASVLRVAPALLKFSPKLLASFLRG
ncbi:MAG: NAD(P)/FAD-dependent oxidoreductase [Methanomassiliicoccales archaeon]